MNDAAPKALRAIVLGLGIQGQKRQRVAASDVMALVDPAVVDASYRTLAEVPSENFDAALVCTPNDQKIDLIESLVAAGKHVLVEKPLRADTATLRRLAPWAREKGVICYTAYNHRFEPHIVRLKNDLDAGAVGRVYLVRMFYGNGTARDVHASPWRDVGTGVLDDLGSHLLDTVHFLFGAVDWPFHLRAAHCFENNAFDHVAFGTAAEPNTPAVELEATYLSWRNRFTADIFGEAGSLHIDGLCKWGPSIYIRRHRVLPSGRPAEDRIDLEEPDPTWEAEYAHFKDLCANGGPSNLENDIWIGQILDDLGAQAGARPMP